VKSILDWAGKAVKQVSIKPKRSFEILSVSSDILFDEAQDEIYDQDSAFRIPVLRHLAYVGAMACKVSA